MEAEAGGVRNLGPYRIHDDRVGCPHLLTANLVLATRRVTPADPVVFRGSIHDGSVWRSVAYPAFMNTPPEDDTDEDISD